MPIIYGNITVPKADQNATLIIFRNGTTGTDYKLLAQPFTGRGRKIEGFYWYYDSIRTATTAAYLTFSLRKDRDGSNIPQSTTLATFQQNIGTRVYNPLVLNNVILTSSVLCTAGVKYWAVVEKNGSWSATRGYNIPALSSSFNNLIIVSTAQLHSSLQHYCTSDSNYVGLRTQNNSGTWGDTYTGYRLPLYPKEVGGGNKFYGQPYYDIANAYSYISSRKQTIYVPAGVDFQRPTVYVYGKVGNPAPLTVRFAQSNDKATTSPVELCNNATFVAGWQTYAGTVTGYATAGYRKMILNTATDVSNYWQMYEMTSRFNLLSYDTSASNSGANAKDYGMGFKGKDITRYIGNITEFSKGSAVPYAKIEIYNNSSKVAEIQANSSGYYNQIATSGNLIIPKKYDWEFTPSFATPYIPNYEVTRNFVQSSESLWWGHSADHHGKMWAFRQKVTFPTPHPTLPVDYLVDIPIQTGNMIRIATSGYFNEAIQHSMSNAICYGGGKTFCAWLQAGDAVNIAGATYDWTTDTWTNHGMICTGVGTWYDTHYYPNLWIDKYGYLYLCRGGHNVVGEEMYITKTSSPYSLTTFPDKALTGTVLGTELNTYPRIAYDAVEDNSYIIYRYDAGDASNVYARIFIRDKDGNYKRPNGSSYTSPSNFIRYDEAGASIYFGGFKIDKDGTLHCVWNPFNNYGTGNRAKAIGYAYSPKYPGATAGIYWYNIWGHTVNTQVAAPGNIIPFTEDGGLSAQYSPFIVYSFTSAEAWTAANRFYHTNTEGLFIHPTRRINNGTHTIRAPYFTFHAYPYTAADADNINNLSDGYICFFDSAYSKTSMVNTPWPFNGKDTILNGWVAHTVTSTAISGIGTRLMKGRHYGSIMIDNADIMHIYGVVRPPEYSGSDYWAGELWEWHSQDGHTFKVKRWTDKSAKGAGMTNFKESLTNDAIEGIYCRGNDLLYISDSQTYPRFKTSGNDIRVVYSSASSKASEINSLGNFYNYTDSHVYFPIKREINSNWTYDTAGNYYIYYGRYDTAQIYSGPNPDNPYRNPEDVCTFFDNFEKYSLGSRVDTAVSSGYALNVSTSAWQYVTINNHTTFNFTSTTIGISCFIKTSNQNAGYIVSKPYSVSSTTGVEWGFGVNAAGNVFIRMQGDYFAHTSNAVDDGNWHHVAMCADGTNWKTWVDGALDYTAKTTKPSNTNSLDVYIGSDRLGNNRFGGKIDNLWFFRDIGTGDFPDIQIERHFPSAMPLAAFNFNQSSEELLKRYNTVAHSVVYSTGLVNTTKWKGYGTITDFKDVNNIKIYSGYQNVSLFEPIKTYFPAISNCAVRVGHWNEDDNTDCGVKLWYYTATSQQYIFINHDGLNQTWRFLSSPWQLATTATVLSGSLVAPPRRMHEYILYIHSTHGVSFQTEQGITFFANNVSGNLGYNKLAMHTINAIELVQQSGTQYFDFVRIYKTYSTPSPYQVF